MRVTFEMLEAGWRVEYFPLKDRYEITDPTRKFCFRVKELR